MEYLFNNLSTKHTAVAFTKSEEYLLCIKTDHKSWHGYLISQYDDCLSPGLKKVIFLQSGRYVTPSVVLSVRNKNLWNRL